MPKSASDGGETRVVLVGAKEPVALNAEAVTAEPLNLTVDGTPALVFRDPGSGSVRAFDRRIAVDLRPRFVRNADPKRKDALFVDKDANAGWNAEGRALDGPSGVRGRRLKPLPVEDGLYWGVMKHWYPSLELTAVQ
jgi:hypothetical protein